LAVFVLDKHKKPLMPCSEKRARLHGFKTADMVPVEVPKGKHAGIHLGRVAVRASGPFRVGKADGIHAKHCKLLHRADGYDYGQTRFRPRA
jgi:hypothetical protein